MKRTKLRRRILSKYDTIRDFATEVGISYPQLSTMLTGNSDTTFAQARKMCEVLEIRQGEIGELFFPDVKE